MTSGRNLFIRRVPLLPFIVEVWEDVGPVYHWKKGTGRIEQRRGTFFRRRTAERFVAWLENQ